MLCTIALLYPTVSRNVLLSKDFLYYLFNY